MLNYRAKFLLAATSMSPIFGAIAVNQFALDRPWYCWAFWLIAALLLAGLCWWLMNYAAKNIQRDRFTIRKFERNDKEVLAFLVAYLLPFISSKDMAFTGDWLTGAYIIVIIFWVIAHSGAFHFNPVMGLLGFHFYEVENEQGVSFLLISRKQINRTAHVVMAVKLATDIYLFTGDADA